VCVCVCVRVRVRVSVCDLKDQWMANTNLKPLNTVQKQIILSFVLKCLKTSAFLEFKDFTKPNKVVAELH